MQPADANFFEAAKAVFILTRELHERTNALEVESASHKKEIITLKEESASQKKEIASQNMEITSLNKKIESLELKVSELLAHFETRR